MLKGRSRKQVQKKKELRGNQSEVCVLSRGLSICVFVLLGLQWRTCDTMIGRLTKVHTHEHTHTQNPPSRPPETPPGVTTHTDQKPSYLCWLCVCRLPFALRPGGSITQIHLIQLTTNTHRPVKQMLTSTHTHTAHTHTEGAWQGFSVDPGG